MMSASLAFAAVLVFETSASSSMSVARIPPAQIMSVSKTAVNRVDNVTVAISGSVNGSPISGVIRVHGHDGEQLIADGNQVTTLKFVDSIGYLWANAAFMRAKFGSAGVAYAHHWLGFRSSDPLYKNFSDPAAGFTYDSIRRGIFPVAPIHLVAQRWPTTSPVVTIRGTTPANVGRASGVFEVMISKMAPFLPVGNHVDGVAGTQHQVVDDHYSRWGSTRRPTRPLHFVWFSATSLNR
jgi:hypothetical protein